MGTSPKKQATNCGNDSGWTDTIRPVEGLFHLNLKELIRYRDLILLFVRRDILTQYKQTILGPLWFVFQPIITVLMYMVVFGHIAGIPTDGIPQPLFYLAGMCLWQYFADCLTTTSNTFVANASIFGKVYFPRLVRPVSVLMSNMVKLGVQTLLLLVVYVIYAMNGAALQANLYAFLLPVLILMVAGLAFGFGLVFCSMTTKYRDLQVLFTFIVQLWMYATPIVYPLSQLHGKQICGIPLDTAVCLNPVTSIIDTFRYALLGSEEFIGWGWLAYSFVFMLVLLLLGIMVFNRVQRNFVDTV